MPRCHADRQESDRDGQPNGAAVALLDAGSRHQRDRSVARKLATVTQATSNLAREVGCRGDGSTGLSERVLDPDAVYGLAVLQVLAEQASASGRARRTNDERIPERQRVQAAEVDRSEN